MALSVICKGCGSKAKLVRAPPGSLPEGWVTSSGAAYCAQCSGDVPVLHLSQRMAEAATAAVIEACSQDPALRASLDTVRASQQPGSPEFIQAVRAAVETACAPGAERFPVALRALFSDVLACVSWLKVAERVARPGISAPIAPEPATPNGRDPFAL